MGLIDIVIIAIIALFFLSGFHKGFIWNLAALGAALIALLIAHLFMGKVATAIVNQGSLYEAMLSYTEGAEAVQDSELAEKDITSLSNDQINEIIERADLPFPIRERVYENIMDEAFKDRGITTLGDYFNESMVHTFINIISFMLVYFVSRIILTFVICWLDYSFKFPRLRIGDNIVGALIGLIRGIVDVFVLFMLVPIVLTILPFEAIAEIISNSAIASFLHRSNIFLKMIPGRV